MQLYLLKITPAGWDCNDGFLIRAIDEAAARALAAEAASDEGPQVWLDYTQCTCECLTPDGEPGILLTDFHAG